MPVPAPDAARFTVLGARALSVWAVLTLLVQAFFALQRPFSTTVYPLNLPRWSNPDASVSVGSTIVRKISVDEGPWIPAGGLRAAQTYRNLAAGTRLDWLEDRNGAAVRSSGVVTEAEVANREMASRLVLWLLATALGASACVVAWAALDARSAALAAAFAALAVTFGSAFIEPAAAQVRDPAWRSLLIQSWLAFPRPLAAWFALGFVGRFPTDVSRTVTYRILRRAALAPAVLTWVLSVVVMQPVLDGYLSTRAQAMTMNVLYLGQPVTYLAGSIALLVTFLIGASLYRKLGVPLRDRQRARAAGAMLFASGFIPATAVLAQATVLLSGKGYLIPRDVMPLTFAPLIAAPPILAWAVLSRNVTHLRVLVRRAALFSISATTVRLASITPLALVLLYLYVHRDTALRDLAVQHPIPLAAATAAAVLGLSFRDRARSALEGAFFRDRADARRLMSDLAEKSRTAHDPTSLELLLSGEIGRVLHAESVALFVRDRSSHTFVCPSRSLPTLDVDSSLVTAAGTKGVLDLDPADRRSPLASLSEIERHWVEESHARLLLPLSAADESVIGLLAVGENLSELPWDKEDKSLLVAAAASGALALENSLLRSSGGAGAGVTRPAATHDEEDLARTCHLCTKIFSASLGPLCPADQVPLAIADVPHVLAGKYRFEKRIGSGGMGVVYLARDLSLGRFVAVKTLPKVSAEAGIRLRREARATARVLHPNLAVIFAAETWHGTPMLMLEYLEGGTLAPRIARGPVPIGKVVEWGIALSGALEAAHVKGVLHRDIKPSNIGFTASDEPKLLDFGLASLYEEPEVLAAIETATESQDLLETAELKQMSGSGRIVGTLPYLAPEAILGEPPQVSFDVWSLALTLYEATTGTNPFLEIPAEKTLNRILSQTAPRARSVRADCPEALSELFADALARKATLRPRSARELRVRLEKLAPSVAA